ncbi:MAG: hypothetical protein ACUZ8O_15750 [Candidatus Anammoxibacter sp.]
MTGLKNIFRAVVINVIELRKKSPCPPFSKGEIGSPSLVNEGFREICFATFGNQRSSKFLIQ